MGQPAHHVAEIQSVGPGNGAPLVVEARFVVRRHHDEFDTGAVEHISYYIHHLQQLRLHGVDREPDRGLGAPPTGDGGITLFYKVPFTEAVEPTAHFNDVVLIANALGDEPVVDFASRLAGRVSLEHGQYLVFVGGDAASSGVAFEGERARLAGSFPHLFTDPNLGRPLKGSLPR